MMALALATVATAAVSTPVGSTQLLTWVGVVAAVLALVLWGLLVPRSSHLRELRIQKEAYDKVVEGLQGQIARQDAEIAVWRGVATVQQTTATELLAQHRLTIDAMSSVNYSIDQMRHGLERAQRETTP